MRSPSAGAAGSFELEWAAPGVGGDVDIAAVERGLAEARTRLADVPVRQIAAAFEDLSAYLLRRGNELISAYPMSGVPFLGRLCQGEQLSALVADSLGGLDYLDRFVPRPYLPQREGRAYPRGLILHWLAGNVPTLGVLSLISAMMTKNASIVRIPAASDRFLPDLLRRFHEMGDVHRLLASAVAVVRYEHQNAAVSEALSRIANVRILWGSDESVLAIRALAANPTCMDIVFSDRTSFAIVGRDHVTGERAKAAARLIAHDASVFEQKACASPHTVLLSTDSDDDVDGFCRELAGAMQQVLKSIPKRAPAPRESAAILNLRGQYAMFHKEWHSQGLEFSILSDREPKLGPPIGNRTIYVRKIPADDALVAAIPPNIQTVGIAAEGDEFERLTERLGRAGVLRFAPLGAMTHFELPWDGYMVAQHLVRWTTRPATTILS
jgi:hypothetical protein